MTDKKKPNPFKQESDLRLCFLGDGAEHRIDEAIDANSGRTIALNFKVTVDKSNTHPKVFTDLSFMETGYEDNGETDANLKQLLKVRRKVSLGVGGDADDPDQMTLLPEPGDNGAETGQGEAEERKPPQDSGKKTKRAKSKSKAKRTAKGESDPIAEAEETDSPA